MKVLAVSSKNSGKVAPFVLEQMESLKQLGVQVEYYPIIGKGISGYLSNYNKLIKAINTFKPDLIHAHYSFSGLLSNLQRKIPVVTTYWGSDINYPWAFQFSKIAIIMSAYNIFASSKMVKIAGVRRKFAIIPGGINSDIFYPTNNKENTRDLLNLPQKEKIILFAGAFNNKVKNYALVQNALKNLENVKIIELNNHSRKQVAMLLNSCDLLLLTSLSEGSPFIIKEALACNCPIVATDVGDVKELINGLEGCYISSFIPADVRKKVEIILNDNKRTNGVKRIFEKGLENKQMAGKIYSIYKQILGW